MERPASGNDDGKKKKRILRPNRGEHPRGEGGGPGRGKAAGRRKEEKNPSKLRLCYVDIIEILLKGKKAFGGERGNGGLE